ncbi:hypothetical protein [Aeromicrobium sp. UC242_57]|uniref:hypothetical protein n=1 Tax=Aeromicrobium sp. UC242_57 TaxID=3374624 RepID=UPI0037B8296A
MRVHSLNCGSFAPPIAGGIVCHVLLCETPDGLVLIDTGLGLDDYRDPRLRMGPTRKLPAAHLGGGGHCRAAGRGPRPQRVRCHPHRPDPSRLRPHRWVVGLS